MFKSLRLSALLALVGLIAACSDGSGPRTGAQVAFHMGTRSTPAAGAALRNPVTDEAGNTIEITSVKVVLRKVEFKRDDDESCTVLPPDVPVVRHDDGDEDGQDDGEHNDDDGQNDDGDDGNDDACESLTIGPKLVNLPLDAGATPAFTVTLDPGTYDEIKVKVHVPVPGNPRDDEFLASPEGQGVDYSVLIEGIYTPAGGSATPFTFKSHLSARQKIRLDPPLVIDATNTTHDVTVKVDVDTWFLGEAGNVLDPATADEHVINHNIRKSFHAFRDEDHDCQDDDDSNHD